MTMEERRQLRNKKCGGSSRFSGGVALIVIGGLLLLQRMGTVVPAWFFTWQMLLIGLGIFIGINRRFHGAAWLMLILIGGIFLAADLYPEWEIRHYSTPIIVIVIGIAFVLRPRNRWYGNQNALNETDEKKTFSDKNYQNTDASYSSDEDYLDITSVLGGTKKNITSKDFKGGEVTSFLGGTELNLSQADINGRIVLELTQVMGGTKLIVPPHWDIKSEIVAVLGSVEDKRQLTSSVDPTKILVLKGTSVFGGIEIRSF